MNRQLSTFRRVLALLSMDTDTLIQIYSCMGERKSLSETVRIPSVEGVELTGISGIQVFSILWNRATGHDQRAKPFVESRRAVVFLHELQDLFGKSLDVQKEQVVKSES